MMLPNNPLVFLLNMIILGVFWGYHHLRKHPYVDAYGRMAALDLPCKKNKIQSCSKVQLLMVLEIPFPTTVWMYKTLYTVVEVDG